MSRFREAPNDVIVKEVRGSLSRKGWQVDEKALGEGAFSRVLKIGSKHDSSDTTFFAAKIILKDERVPGSAITMAEHEVAIMNKFGKHKGLVNLIESYGKNDLYPESPRILVMDLLAGGELFDDIVKRQKYTERDAKNCSKQMLEALKYLHGKGIIHRDLKPENIFLYDKEIVKIGDFGLAVEVDERGIATGYAGTPEYAPPQVSNNTNSVYTNKFDIWSMGIIIYILLAGRHPLQPHERKHPEKHIHWEKSIWSNKSDAKNLILSLLKPKESERLDIDQTIASSWFNNVCNLNNLDTSEADENHLQQTVQHMKVWRAKIYAEEIYHIAHMMSSLHMKSSRVLVDHQNTE